MPVAALSLVALRKNILLGLMAATIIATHMLFAHKEYRFVFPAVPFVVMLTGLGTAEIFARISAHIKNRKLILMALAGTVIGWSIISFVLGRNDHFQDNWYRSAGNIHAFHYLYGKSDMCGVGLIDGRWWESGGYVNLHRDVPIILPGEKIETSYSAYNYALADPGNLPDNWPYSRVWCWNDDKTCVYRRDGPCESVPDIEMNEVLRRKGA